MRTCHYGCGATDDLRPYGPEGAWVCNPCVNETPERKEASGEMFQTMLEMAALASPVGAVTLTDEGPKPVTSLAVLEKYRSDDDSFNVVYARMEMADEPERP